MDYEYAPLRLPSNVDKLTAAAQLAIQAEFSGWELARVQLFRDGTRKGTVMDRIAKGFTRDQSVAIAAWWAAQK